MTRDVIEQIDVVAAIIRKSGRVLIARRAPDEHLAGKWEFPGGKIERGETAEESLKRELEEEFGVIVKVGEFLTENLHDYPGKRIRLMAYDVEHLCGEFKLTVHDEVQWVQKEDLVGHDLAAADVPIAEHLVTNCSG